MQLNLKLVLNNLTQFWSWPMFDPFQAIDLAAVTTLLLEALPSVKTFNGRETMLSYCMINILVEYFTSLLNSTIIYYFLIK